jgi:hypothetical protein
LRLLPLLLLLLAACSTSALWHKPGADAAATAHDNSLCRAQANQALARAHAIDADIAATRGLDWERSSTVAVNREELEAHASADASQVFASCMQAKGYARQGS